MFSYLRKTEPVRTPQILQEEVNLTRDLKIVERSTSMGIYMLEGKKKLVCQILFRGVLLTELESRYQKSEIDRDFLSNIAKQAVSVVWFNPIS